MIPHKHFLSTSVGRKYMVATTAIVWVLFAFAHMAGNFLLFVGERAYNTYSHLLTSGNSIYVIEAVLLGTLLIHGLIAIHLVAANKMARPTGYAQTPQGTKAPSFASQTMHIQGPIILIFIILHLAQFKFGTVYTVQYDGVEMRDIYRLVVETFRQPQFMGLYVFATVALFYHLSHGMESVVQSLGIRTEVYAGLVRKLSLIYAIVVGGGFLVQPIYVYFFAR